jgi:hypothetical protein
MPEIAGAVLQGSVAEMSSDLPESLRLRGLAAASATPKEDTGSSQGPGSSISSLQKAIMLQPWNLENWECLAHVFM